MKKLPPIPGLLLEAAQREKWAEDGEKRSRSTTGDPRSNHEAGESAVRYAREARNMREAAAGNVEVIYDLSKLITYLKASPHQSPQRTLAMRKLEAAEDILRREVGDPVTTEN